MKSKSNLPRRRTTRLRGYDYTQPGAYFVTICAQHRKCLFGTITDGKMQLNEIGRIVVDCWNHIPQHFPSVELYESIVMPNHIHGIIAWGIPKPEDSHPPKTVGAGSPRPSQTGPPFENTGNVGAGSPRPFQNNPNRINETPSPSLGKIMAYFKYQSTKRINQRYRTPGTRLWQRNYHDHIIRDDPDLQRLREYIQINPTKWELDQLHPDNPSKQ